MIDERLLDLDSRKGKAPGGYCETLHYRGRPFIFMNAVGLVDDVMTLLHEAGHAFHAFAAHRAAAHLAAAPRARRPRSSPRCRWSCWRRRTWPSPVGFFSAEDHRRAWLEHLEDILLSLAHIASVDAFQTWIYTERATAATRRRATRRGSASGAGSSGGWTGRGSSASGRALVPPAPHLPVSVLLHRVRHRPAGRAPGVAQQPPRSRRPRCAQLPRGAGARRSARRCPRSTAPRARRSASMPVSSGSWSTLVEEHIDRLRERLTG